MYLIESITGVVYILEEETFCATLQCVSINNKFNCVLIKNMFSCRSFLLLYIFIYLPTTWLWFCQEDIIFCWSWKNSCHTNIYPINLKSNWIGMFFQDQLGWQIQKHSLLCKIMGGTSNSLTFQRCSAEGQCLDTRKWCDVTK